MVAKAKERKVRVLDEDWAEHCAIAEKASISANELVVIYIKRANSIANGRPIVEDNDLPAKSRGVLGGIVGRTFEPNAPGLKAGAMLPFAGDLPARGPLPKGQKR